MKVALARAENQALLNARMALRQSLPPSWSRAQALGTAQRDVETGQLP